MEQSTVEQKPINQWETLAGPSKVEQTLDALRRRGFKADLAESHEEALEKVRALIPDGAQVMTGGSRTLDEIGLTALLTSGDHHWTNLKGEVIAEKDREKQMALRRGATFADYFVGSVQAITTTGQMVAGSATGSQLAAYAYGGKNLIIVAGTQKITGDLDEALRRLREYSTPLEDKRMKGLGARGTELTKILIFEGERMRDVHVILVNERLGF